VSSCLIHYGKQFDYGVFEVDENSLPHITRYITPKMVVILNLFRDQLDRYGEVDVIAQKWQKVLKTIPSESTIILNADDPLVASFGKKVDARVLYFGLSEKYKQDRVVDHATDSIFCQYCGGRLAYTSYFFSHLGDWYCTICGDKRPDVALSSWNSPLPGLYNTYNTLAAVLVGRELGIADPQIESSLIEFRPAFGRQEEFDIDGKRIKLFLSKNPAGFTASLRAVLDMKPKAIMVALNDRIPDGRDVSWVWDVDFEMIGPKTSVVVTGDRVYDIALRMHYADLKHLSVESDTKKAIDSGVLQIKHGETLYVLAHA
jgi:UDP-N-acetylmuramyl tripeptide synthase